MINKLFRLFRTASNERPIAALFFVFRMVFDWFRSRAVTKILGWPKSYLGAGSKILGTMAITVIERAYIGRHAWIEAVHKFGAESFSPAIRIGRGFSASDRLHITSINRIEIGDNCLFGSGVFISDHNHGSYKGDEQSMPLEPPLQRRLVSHGPVIIGSNVWLGDNVIVIGPVRIGEGVVVGANSIVTRDIPDCVISAGVPARILKRFDEKTNKWEAIEKVSKQGYNEEFNELPVKRGKDG
jgi:acetyltransferase-like isoleucine patch superfamily enzyme